LSRQVQDLQEEIGVDLLRRNPTGLTLTAEGKLFLEEVLELLKRADASVEKVRALSRGEYGESHVGYASVPLPPRIIEKGLASDRVVIDTVVSKYADHLPLYRQSVILEREMGLEISRATLDGWVMRVGELLRPVTGAMAEELLAGSYIQADETPVGVQCQRVRGKNHQAYLWQYSRPGGRGSVRFSDGPGTGRSQTVPGQLRGHTPE
jgi:DNA-binding transcriptional LysR family regulator